MYGIGIRLNISFLIVSVILLLTLSQTRASYDPSSYLCSICITAVDDLRQNADKLNLHTIQHGSNTITGNLLDACALRFPMESCKLFFPDGSRPIAINDHDNKLKSSRSLCSELDLCPIEGSWREVISKSSIDASEYDIRVSKALGSRGYDKVRVSIISNSSIDGLSSSFDYTEQFKYKWTSKYLTTGIISVTPGDKNTVDITSDISIDITIPAEGAGVRGVIFGDPCFQSEWVVCVFQNQFQIFNRTVELLNAINGHDDVSFWQILGDNFYDQQGDATESFFQALSEDTKTKIFHTVPGNHDYWVNGQPSLHVPKDQLGNGFMQFYGQDVIASSSDSSQPYDFTNDPDDGILPAASNFFFYNKVGNIGFIGYSGAYAYEDQLTYLDEACTWASTADLDVFLILGHWNGAGDGCDANSTVPALYEELIALPSCEPVASKMKYFMGHKHCNHVTTADVGFMVGAMGMKDSGCTGEFGIPVVDSTDGYFKVYYFPIAQYDSFDNYDEVLSCFQEKGVSGCYDLATLWSSTSL